MQNSFWVESGAFEEEEDQSVQLRQDDALISLKISHLLRFERITRLKTEDFSLDLSL